MIPKIIKTEKDYERALEIGGHLTHFFSIRQGRFESICQLRQ